MARQRIRVRKQISLEISRVWIEPTNRRWISRGLDKRRARTKTLRFKELRHLGYQLTMAELISGRDHGVDADYATAIVSAGYERPTLAELIQLRDHGVTPEYVRSAQKRGGRPSIDRLIGLHDRGPNAEAEPDGGAHLYRSAGLLDGMHRALRDFYTRMFGS
jgi:hypothetical protein